MQQEEDTDKGLEYKIEEERAKLDVDKCTKVTKDTFEAWHKKRRERRLKESKAKDEKNNPKQHKGKGMIMTGRALMKYDANLFKNDEDDDEDDDEEEEKYNKSQEDEDGMLQFSIIE